MDNYTMEALWEDQHDMRSIGERQDDENTDDDLDFAMGLLYPEIDRDDNFDQ